MVTYLHGDLIANSGYCNSWLLPQIPRLASQGHGAQGTIAAL